MNKLLIILSIFCILGCSSKKVNFDVILKNRLEEELGTERFEHIKTLVIVQGSETVYEYYREDIEPETKNDMASAVKSVTALLVGIAVDKGIINSIDDKYYTYFPEYENEIVDSRYKNITIRHLLSMSDGLNWDPKMDWKNIGLTDVKNNPVLYSMKLSLKDEYINNYRYSSLNSQLISALFNKTTGSSMEEFAKRNLFNDLNIKNYTWSKDDQGNTHGGFGLHIGSKEFSKISTLLINMGKVDNKQIVSSNWIYEISSINNNGGDTHPGKYGLHTWIDDSQDNFSYYAMGYGGQFLCVIPALELGWVIASDFDAHRDHHRLIVHEVVLHPID